MIKATDLIKKVDTFKVDNENYTNLTDACKHAAYIALGLNKKSVPPAINAINRINKLAARFEREFLRTSIGCREEDVFYFELFLQFEPSLKEVIRAFREDVTFYGRVNINSINEIKKDFKENYKRVSDIREIFNKGYGAYLIKASFSRGDFEEPSYWDLEVISHYKF